MVQDPGIPQKRQPQVDVCPGRLDTAVIGENPREAAQFFDRRKLPISCHLRCCCHQSQLAPCPTGTALKTTHRKIVHSLCPTS